MIDRMDPAASFHAMPTGLRVFTMLLLSSAPAMAGQIFAFDYSFPGTGATPMPVTASGFLTTTDVSGGSYSVTGVFGTWNGQAITGTVASGGFFGNDNLLFATSPFLDYNGISFVVNGPGDDGFGNVNLYYDASAGGYSEANTNIGFGDFHYALATPSVALFNFSYDIAGAGATPMAVSASGQMSTYQLDPQTYLLQGISGLWNGAAILGPLEAGTYGGNDNLIFSGDPHLTTSGISFQVAGSGDDGLGNVNVFYFGSYTELSDNVDFTTQFNLTSAPEPGTGVLLFAGSLIVLIAGRVARRQKCH